MEEMKKSLSFNEIVERSLVIRECYHRLEQQHHGTQWSVEEAALAFLTDAGLVGRLTMSEQKRWPKGGDTRSELQHKLSECIWWLIILAERMEVDISESMEVFLSSFEDQNPSSV